MRDLTDENVRGIAEKYFKNLDSLENALVEHFGEDIPKELGLAHRSLIVAESIDDSTDRIVRYLSDMGVPINVATVQHFRGDDGRRFLAQVFLVEPEKAKTKTRGGTTRRPSVSLPRLQELARKNGIGELYDHAKDGLQGILTASAYTDRLFYRYERKEGGHRTALIVWAIPDEEFGGLRFTVHATRMETQFGIGLEEIRSWLPPNSREVSLKGWSGSSQEEKRNAVGFNGAFQNQAEVDQFLGGFRKALVANRTN